MRDNKHDPLFGLTAKIVPKRVSKHRFVLRQGRRTVAEFNATKTPVWKKRRRNRAANKVARASRKANR